VAMQRVQRRRAVEVRLATDHARDRLAHAAFDIVAGGLDLGPVAVRSAADRAWVNAALAGPIRRTADRALTQLVGELVDALASGPDDLVARLVADARPEPRAAAPAGSPLRARQTVLR
jgi:hypothetical protein